MLGGGRCDRLLCKIINNILHVISIPQIFVHAEKEKKLKMVRGHRFPTICHTKFGTTEEALNNVRCRQEVFQRDILQKIKTSFRLIVRERLCVHLKELFDIDIE
jgi:hypothetical protein